MAVQDLFKTISKLTNPLRKLFKKKEEETKKEARKGMERVEKTRKVSELRRKYLRTNKLEDYKAFKELLTELNKERYKEAQEKVRAEFLKEINKNYTGKTYKTVEEFLIDQKAAPVREERRKMFNVFIEEISEIIKGIDMDRFFNSFIKDEEEIRKSINEFNTSAFENELHRLDLVNIELIGEIA